MNDIHIILGMYPIYLRFPFSYRTILKQINKHLNRYIINTEKEKEAVKTISNAFKRRQLYRLLSISIPKSKEWIKRHKRLEDCYFNNVISKCQMMAAVGFESVQYATMCLKKV